MNILLAKSRFKQRLRMTAMPPLGNLGLASAVRQHRPQDSVNLFDARIEGMDHYIRQLSELTPDVVGISTMTLEAHNAHLLANIAKKQNPACTVVMGGPHPTAYYEEVLADDAVDVAVLHEGEHTFLDLLGRLEHSEAISDVDGIAYRTANGIVKTKPRAYIQDLDTLPFPAWDMVDFDAYEKNARSMSFICPGKVAAVMTSRSCPYRCTYCHDMFGKGIQSRSVGNVLDELQLLKEDYGIRHIEIVDDIFNVNKVRCGEILQGIIDRKLDLRLAFPNGLRADILTDELIDLFVRAGTEFVCIAIESASPRIQKQIRKHIRLPKIENAIQRFTDQRVFTNCFYMLGFPGETEQEVRTTLDFAFAQPAHTSMFFVVTPFKGTALYEEQMASHPTPEFGGFDYHHNPQSASDAIPISKLKAYIKYAYIRFFADPRRMYRIFRDHPYKHRVPRLFLELLTSIILFDRLNHFKLVQKLRRLLKMEAVEPFVSEKIEHSARTILSRANQETAAA